MRTPMAMGLLFLLCLSCGATDVAATIPPPPERAQPTTADIAPVPIYDPASVANAAPQYSGAVGTVVGDRALADFLLAQDGEVVNLTVSTRTSSLNHGEDWLSLCAEASPSDRCTALYINYEPATEFDIFWQSSAGTDTLSGFYIVQVNQGVMHQGFLSISLLGLP